MLRKVSLRNKLLLMMLLTTLSALVVALGVMITYELRAYHQNAVSEINVQTELLARTTAPALAFGDVRVANENLGFLRAQPRMRAAAIYDASGRVFASYGTGGKPPALPLLPEADGVRVNDGQLVAFKRIVDERQILGTVYLRADYALYERLALYAGIALLVAVVGMLVALGVSTWLQRIVTRPIMTIGAIARDVIEHQDYSRRAGKISDDEVGALVDVFNDMLAVIERRNGEVQRLNEDLERRVHERTEQLEVSNRDLEHVSAAAQAANRAKSEFLSNMSHELRTPLNAIIGFGKLLSGEEMPLTPERHQEFVDNIVSAGEHLLSLINEVLNLAQIEAGKVSLSMEPVALGDVLTECQSMLESTVAQRGLRLVLPDAESVTLKADRVRLKQVLLNLLSNAVKYNRRDGAVSVGCARIAPTRMRISVQDTGQGMRPEQVAALFEPFNRLGQEGSGVQGTGIGLVVTKRLVELMGGEIGVSSTVGSGSTFWIDLDETLPQRVPVRQPAMPAPASATGEDSLATVLCVEDNPSNMMLLQELLRRRADLRVISATDGKQGVEMARAWHPDVILMDNNMPGMTGREAQAVLHGDPQTSGIPVIALTASAMPSAVEQGLAAGYFRYLTKPLDPKQLMEAIDAALHRRGKDDAR